MQGFARVLCFYDRCNDRQGAAVAVHGTDDELVAHCLQGRREAFSELVLRHQKMVYSVARGMLGDAHLAEDLAQDAFLHAYRGLSSYRAQGKFPAWLRMIVTRLCLNYRRDTRREVAWDDLSGHPAELADGPESRLTEWERRGAVQRALDGLPADYRDVVVLRFMEDLTYDEIARHLGVPVSTIETRLHRAKKQLRELLRELLV
jgi:RNA polymerase sigma-70 factor (ECF subfamily)